MPQATPVGPTNKAKITYIIFGIGVLAIAATVWLFSGHVELSPWAKGILLASGVVAIGLQMFEVHFDGEARNLGSGPAQLVFKTYAYEAKKWRVRLAYIGLLLLVASSMRF